MTQIVPLNGCWSLLAIRIDPRRCPNAAREFSGYEYLPDGCGGFLPDAPDRDNHLIDALRYAAEDIAAHRRATTMKMEKLGI